MTRQPQLDGLRALACLGVVACHAAVPGCAILGTVGVQVFFVLSGYLITRILLDRRPDYGTFLVARFRRLAPALALMLLVTMQGLPTIFAASWTINFAILAGLPIGAIGHTWSLALEAQFYAAWPLVACRARGRAVLLAIVALILWEAWLLAPLQLRAINPAGMVTGAVLALRPIPWPAFARAALSWRPLRTVGLLSYGIYLWHCPIAAALPPMGWPERLAILLVVSTALAALSYLTVERWAGCAREPLIPRASRGQPGGSADPPAAPDRGARPFAPTRRAGLRRPPASAVRFRRQP
jgi:peptidoglycan/LPS O-acetylase OafA/YrhL